MRSIPQKQFKLDKLLNKISEWNSQGDRIVFTNGCFDILHLGHVHYLDEARSLGDRLIIGLNSDESVRELKGSSRPFNNVDARSGILAALESVDAVIVFEEQTPARLIEQIKPHTLVKGGDYSLDNIVGAQFVLQNGGEVKSLAFLPGHSTSSLIKKIIANG